MPARPKVFKSECFWLIQVTFICWFELYWLKCWQIPLRQMKMVPSLYCPRYMAYITSALRKSRSETPKSSAKKTAPPIFSPAVIPEKCIMWSTNFSTFSVSLSFKRTNLFAWKYLLDLFILIYLFIIMFNDWTTVQYYLYWQCVTTYSKNWKKITFLNIFWQYIWYESFTSLHVLTPYLVECVVCGNVSWKRCRI